MPPLILPDLTGKELHRFLVQNKEMLIAQKKHQLKTADAFYHAGAPIVKADKANKAAAEEQDDPTEINVKSIINTTNWFDSHYDVHIPGIWKKSLSEAKRLYLLQEHDMSFKGIISDDVKAYTKKILWRDLGVDAEGYTEALVFESLVKEKRNPFMFDQYKEGYVHNHSVGMRYVTIEMAINSAADYCKDELAVWNKYIESIANRDAVESVGYFWAVKEARVAEGSAVVIGSNEITPTESVTAGNSTGKQPLTGTVKQPQKRRIDYAKCAKQFKL